MGIGSMNFAYGEGETSDTTAPTINSITIHDADNIDARGQMVIDIDITEDGSGVWQIYGAFYPAGEENNADKCVGIVFYCSLDENTPLLFTKEHTIEIAMPTKEDTDYFAENGEYVLRDVSVTDVAGNCTQYSMSEVGGEDDIRELFDNNNNRINVHNAYVKTDTVPPQINSLIIKSADHVDAKGNCEAEVNIAEEGSGVTFIQLYLENDEGDCGYLQYSLYFGDYSEAMCSGTYSITMPLNNEFRNGIYTVQSIQIDDYENNSTTYENGEGVLSAPIQINVYNSSKDVTAPTISSFSTQDSSLVLPNVWNVELDITEDESGVGQIDFTFEDADGHEIYIMWWDNDDNSRRLFSGKHNLKIPISPFYREGTFTLSCISIMDGPNGTTYNAGDENCPFGSVTLTLESSFNVTKYLSIQNTDGIMNALDSMSNGQTALIDCREGHIIPKEVFEAIAGKDIILVFQDEDVQWVFDGKKVDPDKCKDVDITTDIHVENGEKTGFADDDKVLVVDFMDNGELPGEADVRVNNGYISAKYAGGTDHLMLSYVQGDKITVEDEHVNIDADEAAVLHIDHNSRFVLSSNKPIKTISAAVIKVNDCVFTGKALNPSVTVVMGSKTLTRQKDYTISMSDNTKVGTAKVVVKGVGNYKGTKTKNFSINPKKAAISKVKVGKKKITVKMKSKPSALGASSYRIEYRIAGKGVWKSTTTSGKSKTIKKLKKGKKYQIRVIAFKGARQGAASAIKSSKKVK